MSLSIAKTMSGQLRDAMIDPAAWPVALSTVSRFANASGVILLSVDERLRHAPCTDNLSDMISDYFSGGWHAVDARETCCPMLRKGQIALDDYFQNANEIESSQYYTDFLAKHKMKWFAGVGAFDDDDLWCLAFQGSSGRGRFQTSDLDRLKTVQAMFAQTVSLSRKSRHLWIVGALSALEGSGEAALVIDRHGAVLDLNSPALSLLGPYISRTGRLKLPDEEASAELSKLIEDCRFLPPEPSAARSPVEITLGGCPFTFKATSLLREEALMFSQAVVLVRVSATRRTLDDLLKTRYGLTDAEIRVVQALARGVTLAEMAKSFRVTLNTVRFQLKSAFAKTETGSQAKLLAFVLDFNERGGVGRI